MTKHWFAYDPESGFERFATEAEARAEAQKALDYYRDSAPEGWNEDAVVQVCWGLVLGEVVEVERRPWTEEDGGEEFDEFVDYGLVNTLSDMIGPREVREREAKP